MFHFLNVRILLGFLQNVQWIASTSRVYVIRVRPKAEDGWRYLLQYSAEQPSVTGVQKKTEKKIIFAAYLCGFRHFQCLKIVGMLVHVPIKVLVHNSGYI